jgi:2-keto-4-pentenoate hydratase/2-oxohepta-3-ene-1,7-dioic acid hydratase in catechol pathway
MGVSVVKFTSNQHTHPTWGVLKSDTVFHLNIEANDHSQLMDVYFKQRALFDASIETTGLKKNEVTFHSPLSSNIQMFAQGLNYKDHRAESGLVVDAEEEENLMFAKAPSSICGPNDTILRPEGCELLDYEIELGLVLKTDIHKAIKVDDTNIGDYIGAYILCNDVSARDFMFGAPMLQWYKGKSQRTFCPAGPILYLLEDGDIDQMYSLQLTLKMNGKIKQDASTDLLIHKPPKTLTDISKFSDMNAGDCILTGTPGGVLGGTSLKTGLAILLNFKNDKKRRAKFIDAQKARATFLQPGDFLELEIKSHDGAINLGTQLNMIAQA